MKRGSGKKSARALKNKDIIFRKNMMMWQTMIA
jgi:hypothetical protein